MTSAEAATLVLESCHSTWIFEPEAMRFRRLLKDGGHAGAVATAWQPYSRLELDDTSESFVVWLNQDGTRRLRSWRHREHCDVCGGEVTTEIDLGAIAANPS